MDPIISGALIGGLGQIGSGVLGVFGRRGPSERDLMWEQQKISQYSAQNLPRYHVQGLKRAGLNPMLAVTQGLPHAAFPGVAAPVDKYGGIAQAVGGAVHSGLEAYRASSEVAKRGVEIGRLTAEIANINASTELTMAQKQNANAELGRIFADTVLKNAQSAHESEKIKLVKENMDLIRSEVAINKWLEIVEELRVEMLRADIPYHEAGKDFYDSAFGRFMRWVEATKNAINPFGGRGIGAPLFGGRR